MEFLSEGDEKENLTYNNLKLIERIFLPLFVKMRGGGNMVGNRTTPEQRYEYHSDGKGAHGERQNKCLRFAYPQ